MLARVDLDRYFSFGPDTPYAAQDVFTNRLSEVASFDAALRAGEVAQGRALVEQHTAPRRNVLVFYGLGGIGKSRLSRELYARFVGAGGKSRFAHRIDFAEGAAGDVEGLLLGLRASLGQVRPVWPAFDLALAVYWERIHPGVAMSEALNQSTRLRRLAGELKLGDQVQDAVEGLLESPGGVLGIFASGARALGRSTAERVRERRLLRDCPMFDPVTSEQDPQRMRPFLASLLAWDLAQLQDSQQDPPRLVVFLDTWERVQEEEPRRGGAEDLLSRIVHLMPNVLFVVTGRDRLRWADEDHRSVLMFGGAQAWPGLAPASGEEPRQHLVGGLSPTDAERYLSTRLLDGDKPAIPEDVRAAIVGGADGLPLYLDLAATRFEQLSVAAGAPAASEFGQPLAEVVLRVMRDLPSDQRCLLRLASLVHGFDRDLLRAGLPDLSDASITRFLRRTVVRHDGDSWAPYSLHDCLRQAVRKADVAADRWSDREWDEAAGRLIADLERRATPELEITGSLAQSDAAGIFLTAWELAETLRAEPGWVLQLAARLQTRGALDALVWVGPATPLDVRCGRRRRVSQRSAGGRRSVTRG